MKFDFFVLSYYFLFIYKEMERSDKNRDEIRNGRKIETINNSECESALTGIKEGL